MLLADEDEQEGVIPHPFWYARVLGIIHADVRDRRLRNSSMAANGVSLGQMVRSGYGRRGGMESPAAGLDRIGYVPDEEDAFGFTDPAWVVRGVHLIPAFDEGVTERYLPKTSNRVGRPKLWGLGVLSCESVRPIFSQCIHLGGYI